MDNYFTGTLEFGGCKMTYQDGLLISNLSKGVNTTYQYHTLPNGTIVIKEKSTREIGKLSGSNTHYFYDGDSLACEIAREEKINNVKFYQYAEDGYYSMFEIDNGIEKPPAIVNNPIEKVTVNRYNRYKVKQPQTSQNCDAAKQETPLKQQLAELFTKAGVTLTDKTRMDDAMNVLWDIWQGKYDKAELPKSSKLGDITINLHVNVDKALAEITARIKEITDDDYKV
jgi:hypothetical protein